ncbi:MAG: hypothetical protein ACQEXV_25090 [Bacillota bacterium]
MNNQNLTKKQILEQAVKENIPLSNHMLDKYVTWGLLKGVTNSQGHHGSLPSTYPRAMESIRLIHRLTSPPYRLKLQDTIFILCWYGLPIRAHILMNALWDYQNHIRCRFVKAKNNMQDVELMKINFADLAEDELRNHFSSPSGGRLKAEDRKALDLQVAEAVEQMVKMEFILNDFIVSGGITVSLFAILMDNLDMGEKGAGQALQEIFDSHNLFKFDTWMQTSIFTDPANEQVLELLIELIRKYWATLSTAPCMNTPTGKEIRKLFNLPVFIANPVGCKLVLYLLMASGSAPIIINWLQTPSNFEAWEYHCEKLTLPKRGE